MVSVEFCARVRETVAQELLRDTEKSKIIFSILFIKHHMLWEQVLSSVKVISKFKVTATLLK